jgi:uncharacterized repeat protein (TIGR01451 family)
MKTQRTAIRTAWHRRLAATFAVASVGALALTAAATSAPAGEGSPPTGSITICHATGSAGNPFVVNSPDASGNVGGHGDHPGDIIPPFQWIDSNGATQQFPGQNWDTDFGGYPGSAWWENGCKQPEPEPAPALSVSKTASAAWDRLVGGWNVTKTGELTSAPSKDGPGEITWDVAWTKDTNVDTYTVSGQITVSNTGDATAENVSVDDSLDGESSWSMSCAGGWAPGDDLAPSTSVTCSYSVELGGATNGTNTVTVDADNAASAQGSAGYTFPGTPVLEAGSSASEVVVSDERFEYTNEVDGDGSVQFTEDVTCDGGTFDNDVSLLDDESVVDSASAQVTVEPVDCSEPETPVTRPGESVDVQIVKDATPQVTLENGVATITYTVVVKNAGPNQAHDVVVADAAPAGVTFSQVTLQPAAGSCSVTPSSFSCSLGSLGLGVTRVATFTGTVTTTGTFVNTAVATTSSNETNLANNSDSASTVVVAPLTPPTPPTPKPPARKPVSKAVKANVCLNLKSTGRIVLQEDARGRVSFRVTRVAAPKQPKGAPKVAARPAAKVAIVLKGAGVYRILKTNAKGRAVAKIRPAKAGIITARISNRVPACNTARLGVVGVFEPPVTG